MGVGVGDGVCEAKLDRVLREGFGVTGTVSRIHSGTATDNFLVASESGERWFAKVYREGSSPADDLAAIELAMFARASGVPVPALRPPVNGYLIAHGHGISISLWEYVEGAKTAEDGLTGQRWTRVGAVVGRMHRHLAVHPAGAPFYRAAGGLCDVPTAQIAYDRLIEAYRRRDSLDEDQSWALDAALHRRSLLPRVRSLLHDLPPLTAQIVHGDLAAPNLMMRGDDVAAVIDFQPPSAHYLAWEVARIGCDPRTITSGADWVDGLARFLEAYRQENPAVQLNLRTIVAAGCAYTLASTYPLGAPLRPPTVDYAGLLRYGRERHQAALQMLDALHTRLQ